jgi:monofunctional biosynthetic peptidoglycan transglycosylase
VKVVRRTLLVLVAGAGLFGAWLLAIWPPPIWYATHFPARTAFMAMRGREGLDRGVYNPVSIDSVAPVLIQAVVTGEDNRFWSHHGIDFVEIRHALGYRRDGFSLTSGTDLRDITRALSHAWERRDDLRGASTITQQLAKNLYLSPSRNPLRKLKEAVTAERLEIALSKRRILELYLNVVELGPGVWGVGAASEHYFGRTPDRLTRSQAAALAGSLPFPLLSNPDLHPGRMRWRQALILRRMGGEPVEVPHLLENEPAGADTLSPAPEVGDSIGLP